MSRHQQPGENITSYITTLKALSSSCEYGSLRESIIKDMIVLGIEDHRLRESLLKDNDLTLEKAHRIVLAAEKAQ